jgi:hypothetical protein
LLGFEFLGELHPLLFQLPQLASALVVAGLGPRDVILEPAQLDPDAVVILLEVLVGLAQGPMLFRERLPFGRPLSLRLLQLRFGALVTLLEFLVALLNGCLLVEQGLPVHGPLELRILEIVEIALLGIELLLSGRELGFFERELGRDVVLQRLEVRDELLVLLEDIGERFRLWRLGAQAAFRPCCK